MGMVAEGGDDLPHVARLLHERLVDRPQPGRSVGGDCLAEADHDIDARQMVGALAMAEGLGLDDPEPRRAQHLVVAIAEALDRQRQRRGVIRDIDDYRKTLEDLPTRPEVIRRVMAAFLEAARRKDG